MTSEHRDRFEWVEHLVPLQFLRVLYDALFPSRFEAIVREGMDGTPARGYARPLAFCLGCWLLLFAAAQAFPWAFRATGVAAILSILPASDRHDVAARLGIDTVNKAVIPATGHVTFGAAKYAVVSAAHHTLGKRFGRVTPGDVAGYLEKTGDSVLALRVRGYASRSDDRPAPFSQTTLIFFVAFGMVPGWFLSHRILSSRTRTWRETRNVHMYNDGWFVASVMLPFSLATYSGEAFGSPWPQRVLAFITIASGVTWTLRSLRLYRVTHDASYLRTALAHSAELVAALFMCVLFSLAGIVAVDLIQRLA